MKNYIILIIALGFCGCTGTRGERTVASGAQVWTVASQTVDCSGVGRQKCLLIKPDGEAEWQFFYSPIAGFDYEPGYEYVISVLSEKVDNPPMDASSLKYSLDKVLSKERKTSVNIPDTSHMFE